MCLEIMMMLLSVPILTNALGAKVAALLGAPARAIARRGDALHSNPMVSAVTAAPAPFKNVRRSSLDGEVVGLLMVRPWSKAQRHESQRECGGRWRSDKCCRSWRRRYRRRSASNFFPAARWPT